MTGEIVGGSMPRPRRSSERGLAASCSTSGMRFSGQRLVAVARTSGVVVTKEHHDGLGPIRDVVQQPLDDVKTTAGRSKRAGSSCPGRRVSGVLVLSWGLRALHKRWKEPTWLTSVDARGMGHGRGGTS